MVKVQVFFLDKCLSQVSQRGNAEVSVQCIGSIKNRQLPYKYETNATK